MTGNDDRLREWFDAAADEAAPSAACPSPEILWAGANGELAGDRLERLVDHLATCASCDEDWKLAIEIGATIPDRRQSPVGLWIALAAAAVIVIAAAVELRPHRPPSPTSAQPSVTFRAPNAPTIATLIPDGAELPRDRVQLRWSALGEGARYGVEVATEDLTVVDRVEGLTTNGYVVPAAKTQDLPPGTRLVWQVSATTADGRQVRSVSFRVVVR